MSEEDFPTELTALLNMIHDSGSMEDLETTEMVNLYLLLNQVKSNSDNYRKDISKKLCEKIGAGGNLKTDMGSITIVEQTRTDLRDENEAIRRLRDEGVDLMEVMSIDESKVKEKCEEIGIDIDELFDEYSYSYARKTDLQTSRIRELASKVKTDRVKE